MAGQHDCNSSTAYPTLDFVESIMTPRLKAGRGPPRDDMFLYTSLPISSESNRSRVRDTEYRRPSCDGGHGDECVRVVCRGRGMQGAGTKLPRKDGRVTAALACLTAKLGNGVRATPILQLGGFTPTPRPLPHLVYHRPYIDESCAVAAQHAGPVHALWADKGTQHL